MELDWPDRAEDLHGGDPSSGQDSRACQSYGEEVLVPTYLPPPSPPSNEHDTVFLLDGNRSANARAHVFSKA